MKKILFITGTRADFSKIKSLMKKIQDSEEFELFVFATGMHLSKNFGLTVREIEKSGFKNIFRFINHDKFYQNDLALASTINGLSKFVAEFEPDLIVVHGDRIEPLAGAIVGALNNILVAHIEGGEVSGTIDDSLRHAISKLSHIHLVNDECAKNRLLQMGESENSIFIIGSPDLDVLSSNQISLEQAKQRYGISFDNYAIVLFHPVTTEFADFNKYAKNFTNALVQSNKNFIIIYPNNDLGFEFILEAYKNIENNHHFKIFPSIRFEYFISLLKGSDFIIGNSSCGIKEALFLGIESINIGSRQKNRKGVEQVINVGYNTEEIKSAINNLKLAKNSQPNIKIRKRSDERFYDILKSGALFNVAKQKVFKDLGEQNVNISI